MTIQGYTGIVTNAETSVPHAWVQAFRKAEKTALSDAFESIEAVESITMRRVMEAFRNHRVSEQHFYTVNGYGHDDAGRDALDAVFATAMKAEAALVRPHFVSGTHTLSVALRGCLSPGGTLVIVTGNPYDTLEEVLGLRGDSRQSLIKQGVSVHIGQAFGDDGQLSPEDGLAEKIASATVVYFQRSCGYASNRPTYTVDQIGAVITWAKQHNPTACIMVDNCYGEFTEADEPTAVGADLLVGSLIKNPGGGLAPTGGYIAGSHYWVDRCAEALTAPGIGNQGGAMLHTTPVYLKGLFLAPSVVASSLKGMVLAAHVFDSVGYTVSPKANAQRSDIIQRLTLGSADALLTFCRTLQANSPVDSHLRPEPAKLPGYADLVIMAGGTFVQGSTIELSGDGPMREPYTVFLQGGLVYSHTRWVLAHVLSELGHSPKP
jgi:cystathionine beta-lyase family protein involved in aluminum resistance